MKLTADWKEFQEEVKRLVIEGNQICDSYKNSKTENEYESLKTGAKAWANKVFKYLNSSFDADTNDFAYGFLNAKAPRYNVPGTKKGAETQIKEQIEDLSEKTKTLSYYLRILSVSDAIIRPEEINLEERKKFETDDILELLMDKLYELYDDYFHSVATILSGNGIELKRHNEERELANALEEYGYVKLTHTRNVNAQLTLDGKRYVEAKRKAKPTDYSKINKSEEELNAKIDEIKLHLTKVGLGQQILFDELEELKELYTKLNKKNWGEVLKGKLIDLGLSEVINKETMGEIFRQLTDQVLMIK